MTTSFERDLPEKYLFSDVFVVYRITEIDRFSAYAEDYGLWPWMNGKRITLRSLGRRGVCFGGFRLRTRRSHRLARGAP